jgi:hypothetical protein
MSIEARASCRDDGVQRTQWFSVGPCLTSASDRGGGGTGRAGLALPLGPLGRTARGFAKRGHRHPACGARLQKAKLRCETLYVTFMAAGSI